MDRRDLLKTTLIAPLGIIGQPLSDPKIRAYQVEGPNNSLGGYYRTDRLHRINFFRNSKGIIESRYPDSRLVTALEAAETEYEWWGKPDCGGVFSVS